MLMIALEVSQAIPVGKILNEIVTNALKYALPNEAYLKEIADLCGISKTRATVQVSR